MHQKILSYYNSSFVFFVFNIISIYPTIRIQIVINILKLHNVFGKIVKTSQKIIYNLHNYHRKFEKSYWKIKNIELGFLLSVLGGIGEKATVPNPKPQTPNPKPQTPNPKPQTPNPKPQTPNPKPQTPKIF